MDHPYSISDFAFSFRRREGTTRDLIERSSDSLDRGSSDGKPERDRSQIRVGPIVVLTVRERSIEAGTANIRCAILRFVRSPNWPSSASCRQTILPGSAITASVPRWKATSEA